MIKSFILILFILINYSVYSQNTNHNPDSSSVVHVVTKSRDRDTTNNPYYSEGVHGIIEAGYAIGISKFELNNFKFNFVVGHMFNENFMFGAGTGIRIIDNTFKATILIPIFADLRFYFTNKGTSPYLQLSAGHSINTDARRPGGVHLQGVAGANFLLLSNKNALHMGVGYEKQDVNSRPYSMLSINVGTSF